MTTYTISNIDIKVYNNIPFLYIPLGFCVPIQDTSFSMIDNECEILRTVNEYNIPALWYGGFYRKLPYFNASVDYHLIELCDFPNLKPLTKNRRKEYKKAYDIYKDLGLYVKPITDELWKQSIPKTVLDDSSIYYNTRKLRGDALQPIGYFVNETLVAIGLLFGVKTVNTIASGSVLFSATIQILDTRYKAKELTIALAKYAKDLGCDYLDLFNIYASPREDYKRIFFTKEVQLPCFCNNFIQPWIHYENN